MKRFVTALVACVASVSAFAQERPQDRWNLADIYPSIQAWNDDATKLEKQLGELGACKGQLGSSAKRLSECLGLQYASVRLFYRLAVYSNELNAEDTGATPGLELQSRTGVLGSRLSEATSWGRPEILAIGAEKIEAFQKQEPGLAVYRHPLARHPAHRAAHARRQGRSARRHVFGSRRMPQPTTYQILANADMPWPTVKLADGKEVKLDQPALHERTARVANRDDRKKVFDAFFGKWKEFERTFGVDATTRA